ncbi:MAG: hypothetical protein IT531_24835 [Burkholderiales bacterium]|nr:hypothetical protein [Burkholderiales bacterium]
MTKLQAARTRLILDQPFIGALLLALPFEPVAWCESLATDARRIYFDAAFIDRLDSGECRFWLAHQALHCALGHFARRQHRVRALWDRACDQAVNHLLAAEGMRPPQGAHLDERFRGLSAEETYPLLDTLAERSAIDLHLFDGAGARDARTGARRTAATDPIRARAQAETVAANDAEMGSDAASQPRRDAERAESEPAPDPEHLLQRWEMRAAMAAQQARLSGRLAPSWERVLGRVLTPVLPWRALLARHLVAHAQEDYSFVRPARRAGEAILPRLYSRQLDLYVVLDTSGSVGAAQLNAFAAEIDALKSQVRARVTLHACDERLATGGPWTFQPWEALELPQRLTGGAGTDLRPVFDWISRDSLRPDVLVYFTDADGEFPSVAPPYPVLWIVQGARPVPWGERIQLN